MRKSALWILGTTLPTGVLGCSAPPASQEAPPVAGLDYSVAPDAPPLEGLGAINPVSTASEAPTGPSTSPLPRPAPEGAVAPTNPTITAAPEGGEGVVPSDAEFSETEPTDLASEEPPPATADDPLSGESFCLADITDFGSDGPFSFNREREGRVNILTPEVPSGCRVPVVHLANGTGANCAAYQRVLNRFASHGFLTTCYESAQTGAGTQGVEAFETALEKHPELAANRLGSTGHSQGGQAAFTVLQQSEAKWGTEDFVFAGLAMQPASGFGAQPRGTRWQTMYSNIESPMFMFSGTADALVSAGWVASAFRAMGDNTEAYNWSARGATHIPTPQGPTMEVGVPWFRWKLLGDNEACKAFYALADTQSWNAIEDQNAVPCL